METSAVFWEPKIKTYGFQLEKDLSLWELEIQWLERDSMDALVEILEKREFAFSLLLGQVTNDAHLNLYLVVKREIEDLFLDPQTMFKEKSFHHGHSCDERSVMNSSPENERKRDRKVVQTPVELVHFQGPHYCDRYGIAYTAFKAIESKGISIIASGCSVSCVYLLLPEGYGEQARQILNERFEVPKKRQTKV